MVERMVELKELVLSLSLSVFHREIFDVICVFLLLLVIDEINKVTAVFVSFCPQFFFLLLSIHFSSLFSTHFFPFPYLHTTSIVFKEQHFFSGTFEFIVFSDLHTCAHSFPLPPLPNANIH